MKLKCSWNVSQLKLKCDILQFETNTFCNLRQIHFAILDKYISEFEFEFYRLPQTAIDCHWLPLTDWHCSIEHFKQQSYLQDWMRWDWLGYTRCFFTLGLPLKVHSTNKLILARLGVSRTIYVNVDSPNLGFPYFNFLGETQCKKTPCMLPKGLQNNTKSARQPPLPLYTLCKKHPFWFEM